MSFGHIRLVEKEKVVWHGLGSVERWAPDRAPACPEGVPVPRDLSVGLRLGCTNELPFALQLPSTV